MQVTLLRHCEIIQAYQGSYIGHLDAPLSQKGLHDAKEVATWLDKRDFSHIFSSDLLRAKSTLQYSKYAKKALYTPMLREKSWGRHEGMRFEQICQQEGYIYSDFKDWLECLDGEDYSRYIRRIRAFFLHFLLHVDAKNILVVTHAGVIRVLMMLVENISLEEAFSYKIGYGKAIIWDVKAGSFSRV